MRTALPGAFAALFFAACFIPVDEYPEGTGALGAVCDADRKCQLDLECWDASANPGPVGGLCTKTCSSNDDCGETGLCTTYEGEMRCFKRCSYLQTEAEKCGGRLDLACRFASFEVMPLVDVCLPTCANDTACGNGYCDRDSGMCVDAPPSGLANNERCDDDGDCAGFCAIEGDSGVCAEWCTVGAPGACDASVASGSLPGRCFDPDGMFIPNGDGFFCANECGCNQDCPNPVDFACDADLIDGKHYCRYRTMDLGEGLPCALPD